MRGRGRNGAAEDGVPPEKPVKPSQGVTPVMVFVMPVAVVIGTV
jgi:hypothetical protein